MANTTGGDRLLTTPWTTDLQIKAPAAIPAVSTTFYAAQLVGRDVNGNIVNADDTSKYELVGVNMDIMRAVVDPTDVVQTNGVLGDKMLYADRPLLYTAKIAAAAAGDEGKRVYVKFNNEVSYSPGLNGNYAGQVYRVFDSTHVTVLPPWAAYHAGMRANVTLAAGPAALTKFDVNKTFQTPAAAPQTVTLPPVAQTSPGDRITVIYTGGTAQVVTLAGNGAETINGANTFAMATTQYTTKTVESDGTKWFLV